MSRRLIEILESIVAAEARALQLRKTYGLGAERFCDGLIANRAARDPEREWLKDVRRALRWL